MTITKKAFSLEKLRNTSNASRIIALMIYANDMERMAYLRKLNEEYEIEEFANLKYYCGSYSLLMLCGHHYEVLLLIEYIRAAENLRGFIDADPDLTRLYSTTIAPMQNSTLKEQCKRIRNILGFHYRAGLAEIEHAMDKILQAGFTSEFTLMKNGSTLFHDGALNIQDSAFVEILGGSYTGLSPQECNDGRGCTHAVDCNHKKQDVFIKQVESGQAKVREFADQLIHKFIDSL